MPDNLPSSEPPFFALYDHALVALDGPDAAAFAQAQFANDVVALADGHWQWNAWLTPKGRVIAVFALLRLASDRIILMVPDADAGQLAVDLQRFVFRRKLKIAARDDLQVGGAFRKADLAENARIATNGGELQLDYSDSALSRTLIIASSPLLPDAGEVPRWQASDLRAGLPRLTSGQREQWTPQQLSLERLQAFSVKKGCYPGQEIVARTHFLGKAKRGLALFQTAGVVAPGMEINEGDRAAGTIVSVASGQPSLALAVLPIERAAGQMHAGGIALQETGLTGGLQR